MVEPPRNWEEEMDLVYEEYKDWCSLKNGRDKAERKTQQKSFTRREKERMHQRRDQPKNQIKRVRNSRVYEVKKHIS